METSVCTPVLIIPSGCHSDTLLVTTMRHTMEGHINTGFTPSISSLALHTKQKVKAGIAEDEIDVDEGLHDVSIVSDLVKEDAPSLLHGYCDRSFEKAILTFTNGDTETLSNPDTINIITRDDSDCHSNQVVDVEVRLGKYKDKLNLFIELSKLSRHHTLSCRQSSGGPSPGNSASEGRG